MALSKSPSEEKKAFGDVDNAGADAEVPSPTRWSAWFGGPNVIVGPRISPLRSNGHSESDTEDSSSAILQKQLALEAGCAIQYRTCSWQKVALRHLSPAVRWSGADMIRL